jgi:hypothetical protein
MQNEKKNSVLLILAMIILHIGVDLFPILLKLNKGLSWWESNPWSGKLFHLPGVDGWMHMRYL